MKTLQRTLVGIFSPFLILFSLQSKAQLQAVISVPNANVSCQTTPINFTDASQGNPTERYWDFGDNTSSTAVNVSHTFPTVGSYRVKLVVKNSLGETDTALTMITVSGVGVQYSKTMDTTCSAINVKFSSKGTGSNPLTYVWDFGDGKRTSSITPGTIHSYRGGSSYYVNLTVKDNKGCSVKVADTLAFGSVASVLPSTPNTLMATRECIDAFGWTNYYNDNNTPADTDDDILLLSLRKNGNSIGTIGDGTFKVKVTATQNAGSSQGILLNSPVITNPSGYYVMNRYWAVEPTTQPATAVGVRFYFNDQDVHDINGSFPTHDASFEQLIFYKTRGGDPDPSTNLAGATDIVSIFNGADADETHWVYAFNGGNSHSAEFRVSSFSGGGAGVTVNALALPVKLISFIGKAENSGVKLNWAVTSEINVDRYEIEASADGRTFTSIGSVSTKVTTGSINDYTFSDVKVSTEKAKFYKLTTIDKDGKRSHSEIIKVSLPLITNAISLYPVPASSYVTIASKSIVNKNCTVEVYNSIGLRVIKTNKTAAGSAFELNTSGLPGGRYRMIISNNREKIGDANFIIAR